MEEAAAEVLVIAQVEQHSRRRNQRQRLPRSMNLNRPLQIQKQVQRRLAEGGRYKNNSKEPVRRRRY
jgi:hypothetical protein